MSCGDSVSDVPEHLKPLKRNGNGEISTKVYDQNNRRMHPDRPCHTIAASFYANFVHQIRAFDDNLESEQLSNDLPGINEAIRGMAFIENAVFASQSTKKWHSFSMQPQENSL